MYILLFDFQKAAFPHEDEEMEKWENRRSKKAAPSR
jgi:hypothetical protein